MLNKKGNKDKWMFKSVYHSETSNDLNNGQNYITCSIPVKIITGKQI